MRFCFAFLLLGLGIFSKAQINTDRPTQSASAFVLPQGEIQAEVGFLSERPFKRVDLYNVQYLNTLIRVGVLNGVELRLTQNFLGTRINGEGPNGLSPTTLGTKIHLLEENAGIPQISVIGQVTLANGGKGFESDVSTKEMRLNFQNTISDRVSLGYNIGGIWAGSENTLGLYSVVLGISIAPDLTFFLEPYGFIAKNTPKDGRFNTGLIYAASDKFQMDISAGNGLTKKAPDYFLSFGVTVLL